MEKATYLMSGWMNDIAMSFRVLTSWERSWQPAQSVSQVEMCKEKLTNILIL